MGVYDIRFYLALRKRQGISNRSLENTRANLSAFFQWMMRENLIISNPCLNIKPIKYKQELRMPFSDVEIDALRSACKTLKERAIIELLLSSGIRVSELVMLNVDDIDKQALSVHIKHGKGNKERTTYITKVAMKHIENYLNNRNEQDSALFCNYQHQRMHDNGVRYLLNKLAKRANVANVHPHRFRRTFACCLSARGMNIQDIQKLLGHTNINTTMEYVTIDDGRLQSSYQYYIV
jgi:site-specific recombinase XerD